MRSKESPLYIDLRVAHGHIFRGLFYGEFGRLMLSVDIGGDEILNSGPWNKDELALEAFEKCVANYALPSSTAILDSLRKKGATLFVAKESGKWSIVAGLQSGKFVDTELRFDTEAQAIEVRDAR